jgi:hypothetical protein
MEETHQSQHWKKFRSGEWNLALGNKKQTSSRRQEFDIFWVHHKLQSLPVGKKKKRSSFINRYYNGNLWLNCPVRITGGLIHRIIGIPHGGTLVPKTLNSNDWMFVLTGGTSAKNSKVLLINRVTDPRAKWACIIISLFLIIVGRASNVKLTMFDPIDQILQSGAQFDWAENLATLMKSNYKECQETIQAIKFMSLLIWLTMRQVSPVMEPTFTRK